MKKILIFILILVPYMVQAQKLTIYTDSEGYNYFAIYAYGLPREVVKSNQEIASSKFGDTGILRRHHTTKDEDEGIGSEGYECNNKLSFAFIIAPYNVDGSGNELPVEAYQAVTNWYEATGWDTSSDAKMALNAWDKEVLVNYLSDKAVANPTPTGCAAYKGPHGTDPTGTWRLPTQREALTMFTIMEHALTMQGAEDVINNVSNALYWTSTEFNPGTYWQVWTLDSEEGSVIFTDKINAFNAFNMGVARCVRDIDDDPINN